MTRQGGSPREQAGADSHDTSALSVLVARLLQLVGRWLAAGKPGHHMGAQPYIYSGERLPRSTPWACTQTADALQPRQARHSPAAVLGATRLSRGGHLSCHGSFDGSSQVFTGSGGYSACRCEACDRICPTASFASTVPHNFSRPIAASPEWVQSTPFVPRCETCIVATSHVLYCS